MRSLTIQFFLLKQDFAPLLSRLSLSHFTRNVTELLLNLCQALSDSFCLQFLIELVVHRTLVHFRRTVLQHLATTNHARNKNVPVSLQQSIFPQAAHTFVHTCIRWGTDHDPIVSAAGRPQGL